jgi:hypothetical protein
MGTPSGDQTLTNFLPPDLFPAPITMPTYIIKIIFLRKKLSVRWRQPIFVAAAQTEEFHNVDWHHCQAYAIRYWYSYMRSNSIT